eukprot:Gb_10453 [translate_table: standard]
MSTATASYSTSGGPISTLSYCDVQRQASLLLISQCVAIHPFSFHRFELLAVAASFYSSYRRFHAFSQSFKVKIFHRAYSLPLSIAVIKTLCNLDDSACIDTSLTPAKNPAIEDLWMPYCGVDMHFTTEAEANAISGKTLNRLKGISEPMKKK